MRIKVTITYEYDVEPENYPQEERSPTKMAQLDFDADPTSIILYAAEDLTLWAKPATTEEVKS
jgi:hypothetical protein